MVFKRRDRRPIWKIVLELLWPRGGWSRAAQYVKHRIHRLPDPPDRIARGIFAGVFTTFTPFYGLHFLVAGTLAWIMRGNIVAALLATFFGNPLTYVPIAVASLKTGYWLLDMNHRPKIEDPNSLGDKFGQAAYDLWNNFLALFTDRTTDWHGLSVFYDEVFFPYMIGGIIPGILTGLVCYLISRPLIAAYQNRRKGALKAKIASLKKKRDTDGRSK